MACAQSIWRNSVLKGDLMKLWNIKTGALWEGSPVDARELLARGGGWSKDAPVPIAPPEIETVKPDEPVKWEGPSINNEPVKWEGTEPESPREKRKYTRHWEK